MLNPGQNPAQSPNLIVGGNGADVRSFNRSRLSEFDRAFRIPPASTDSLATQLVKVVNSCYRLAAEFRCQTGVQEQMEYSLAASEDRYDAKTASLIEKGKDVYIGLTSHKCRALQGWLQDILVNSEDKPWVLSATPQPQLPGDLERQVVARLQQELQNGTLTPEELEAVLPRIRSTANKHAQNIAAAAIDGMQQRLLDLMLEGGWRKTFENVFVDVSIYPAAIIRGPVVRMRPRLRHREGEVIEVREPQIVIERVSPFDFFPSPDSTTPQDGTFVIERQRMSRKDMMDALNTPGFREREIRSVLAGCPHGTQWWGSAPNDEASRRNTLMYETGQHDNSYKVLTFYGKVERRMLYEYGVEGGDPHDVVEAEVWVVNNQVIRAELNPRPLDRRPFDVARFQPIPGAFWGRSLPMIVKDPQRMVNAAARALVGNMGLASGPIVEMDHTRLEGEPDPQNLFPWRVYMSKPDMVMGSNSPAIRFHNVNNVTSELQNVIDRYELTMDNVSGIPAFATGAPHTGGAGRTLGGLSMLLGNAARGIKRVISSMDKDMIEPMIHSLYVLEMMYGEDKTIKTDAQIVARGSSGLLQRQLSQTRAVDLLQVMAPFLGVTDEQGNALVPVNGLRRIMFDIVRSAGYTSDEVLPDPARGERLQILQNITNQPQALQATPDGLPPGTPGPALDGRSAPALNAGQAAAPIPPA